MHELVEQANEIMEIKAKGYDSGGVKRDDYWIYGASSIITELYRKCLNLVSLDKSEQLDFASAAEILVDMVNYETFLWDYLKEKDG